MDDDMKALGERVVKCSTWRWMPGMRAFVPWDADADLVGFFRLFDVEHTGVDALAFERLEGETSPHMAMPEAVSESLSQEVGWPHWTAIPDLTDSATLGCLLQLVREVWSSDVEIWREFNGLICVALDIATDDAAENHFLAHDLGEALVAALEAADTQETT